MSIQSRAPQANGGMGHMGRTHMGTACDTLLIRLVHSDIWCD